MDSLADLIINRQPQEPPELKALRDYVKVNHDSVAKVAVTKMGYSLTVDNAALASNLRMEVPKIRVACGLNKKLFIRIGG
jgi:hypothetical protein